MENINKQKITIAEFMYNHKHGRFAIVGGGHMIAYIEGVWWDTLYNIDNRIDNFVGEHVFFAFYKCDE